MTKRVHTILCWILAISLVWLPLSVSADILQSSTNKDACHKMNSAMPMSMLGHNMSDRIISDYSRLSAMSGQTAAIDGSMHESMMQKGCCDQCADSCVACTGMASCGHSPNTVSAFILFNRYSSRSLPLFQTSIEQFVQYHNQIITPDIRPPIV